MTDTELSEEELDRVLEFFTELEYQHGWKEAVRIVLVFHPKPERIWQIKDHASQRVTEARANGDTDTERRYRKTTESLSILGKKAEKLPPLTLR